ncbi:MAG: hypothetical protein ACLSAP_01335, partial [Oscillospiraceae bacterium]
SWGGVLYDFIVYCSCGNNSRMDYINSYSNAEKEINHSICVCMQTMWASVENAVISDIKKHTISGVLFYIQCDLVDFDPCTPCGVRPAGSETRRWGFEFQSTHPVRGATNIWPVYGRKLNFNPHPCGCDHLTLETTIARGISIHAPRAGCDSKKQQKMLQFFQYK